MFNDFPFAQEYKEADQTKSTRLQKTKARSIGHTLGIKLPSKTNY